MNLFNTLKRVARRVARKVARVFKQAYRPVVVAVMIATVLVPPVGMHAQQGAVFPGRAVTSGDLPSASFRGLTVATAPIGAADTTISIASNTTFPPGLSTTNATIVVIDSEELKICGSTSNSFTVCAGGRGFDSTTPASHANGVSIFQYWAPWNNNQVAAEIKAIEARNLLVSYASDVNFAPQTPGGSLSAGNNTITMTPVPYGVNGTDNGHRIWVSGGTGTAEGCLISGGTGTSGATSGQIILNCANTHSGAWTVGPANAGIQEAIQLVQTAGGGLVLAGGPTTLTALGSIAISANNVTLQFFGLGVNFAGTSVLMSGVGNAVLGTGNTPLTATTTTGDVIQLNGCLNCEIAGLFIDRTATPAISGAGINIASGVNTNLKVHSVTSRHHYEGILAVVAPVVSAWTDIEIEHSVDRGVWFQADNDEHFTNLVVETSGSHAVEVGNGSSTTNCVGGFRVTNLVTFNNGGDGVHLEGAAGSACSYVFLSNIHADTDTGYELNIKNTGAVTIAGAEFINGKGVLLDTGASGVVLSGIRINGSSQEDLMITNSATRITGAGILLGDASLGHSGVSYTMRVNNSASLVNLSGVTVSSADTVVAGGLLVEVGTGNPTAIHMNGVQITDTGNMTSPVTIASGLTDIFVDSPYTWTTLALSNSWTATSSDQYRLESNGNTVRIKGTIAAGTTTDGTTVFTLPASFRPAQAVACSVVMLGGGATPTGIASITISSGGVGAIYGASGASFLRLDGISFSIN